MKHIEIKSIETKGVKVVVKLDYDAGTASLVEAQKGSLPTIFKAKDWVFNNREVEYMQGWLDILEAMTVAVKECKKELSVDKELKEKRMIELLAEESGVAKKKNI